MRLYYAEDGIAIFHGDYRDVLPQLQPVDHVITDPPYDQRTHEGARSCGESTSRINFAPLDVAGELPAILAIAARWTVCFCTFEMVSEYRAAAGTRWVRAGFWRRLDGTPQFSGDRPAVPGDVIAIMHASGRKRWNGGGSMAYWEYGVERGVQRVHPAQKPKPLMAHLVRDFSDPGDVILDPFMGSGTTLVAAKRLQRQAIGIEREERYCEIAAQRLAQRALPLALDAAEDDQTLLPWSDA